MYIQKGGVSKISVSFFVIDFVWSNINLNIKCSGFNETENLS